MRKMFFKSLVVGAALVMSASAVMFSACRPEESTESHDWFTEWSYDKTNHWHDCDTLNPADVKDKAAHTLGANGACTECGWKEADCSRVCPECGQCIDVNQSYNVMLVESADLVRNKDTDFGVSKHADEVLCGHDLKSNMFYAAEAVFDGGTVYKGTDSIENDEEGNPIEFTRAHGTADYVNFTYTFVIYSNAETYATMRVRGSRASAATKTYTYYEPVLDEETGEPVIGEDGEPVTTKMQVKSCHNPDYPKFTDVMKTTVNDEVLDRDAVTLHGSKGDIGWTNLGCIKLQKGMNIIMLSNSSVNALNANRKGYNLSILELLTLPGVDLVWTPKINELK